MIKIAVINKARVPLGVDLNALVSAMQIFSDDYFGPAWGTGCELVKSTKLVKGTWHFIFFDKTGDKFLEVRPKPNASHGRTAAATA